MCLCRYEVVKGEESGESGQESEVSHLPLWDRKLSSIVIVVLQLISSVMV